MNKTLILFREIGVLLFASAALGLGYNVFSPKAMPLVRTGASVVASDSLIAALAKANAQPSSKPTAKPDTIANGSTDAVQNVSASTSTPRYTTEAKIPDNTRSIAPPANTIQTRTQPASPTIAIEQPAVPQLVTSPKVLEIRFDQVEKLLANPDVLFIDARTAKEYAVGHIGNAINIFTPEFEQSIPRVIGLPRDKPIVAYCGGGACELSHELARHLLGLGFMHVFVYVGGWNEWQVKKSGVGN